MQLGFTSTTFRQIKDLEKIVTLAKDAGVEYIEWGGDIHVTDLAAAYRAKRQCEREGIGISSYASYYKVGFGEKEDWRRICEIASALGAGFVRVWLGKADSEKTDEETYRKILADTKAICDTAADYGLTVCPECHDRTFNNNTDAFLRLREDAGRENLQTYFQSRYQKKAYDLDRIERTLPYIQAVHISYSEQLREQFPHYDPTYIDALLRQLHACGYDGLLLLEYTYIFGRFGLPGCMKKDILKLREAWERNA